MADSPSSFEADIPAAGARPSAPDGSGSSRALDWLHALTLNHRTIGAGALQQRSLACNAAMTLHDQLTGAGVESLVLTTCNRTEVYWRERTPEDVGIVTAAFAQAVAMPAGDPDHSVQTLSARTAARHLFRVCSGLESLIVGEAEILGQVRTALDACRGAGSMLTGVVQAALRTGRLVRAETGIGVGALSVASAAVQQLSQALPLARSRVVVIGAGETGLKVARHLRSLGVGQLVVANRTRARAEAVAAEVGAAAADLDCLPQELVWADAIVCAVTVPQPIVHAPDLRSALARRGGSLPVLVDLSAPQAVTRENVPGLTRIDLATLEQHVAAHRDRREAEVPRVEAYIDRELDFLQGWARQQALRPLVSELRKKMEAIRRGELARVQGELPPDLQAEIFDRFSKRLLDQVLALPIAALEEADVAPDAAEARALRRLFALEPGAPL
jgi:glutamyl-tRNA reductase